MYEIELLRAKVRVMEAKAEVVDARGRRRMRASRVATRVSTAETGAT